MGRDRREVGHEIHVLSNMIGRKIDEEKRQRNMGDVSPVQTWVTVISTIIRGRRSASGIWNVISTSPVLP